MIFGKKKKEAKGEEKEAPKKAAEKDDIPQLTPADRSLKSSEIKEKMAEGWIRVLITFEIVGKPREHVEQTLNAYMTNLKGDERIGTVNEEYAEPMEHDDGMFSAFCEFEAVVQTMEVLTWIAINFMPASIEILEPEMIRLEGRVIANWSNDLLAKLHEVSNILREERSVNQHLTAGMNALIKNGIIAGLKAGPAALPEIEKFLGIPQKQLEPFLKNLIEKGKLHKDGERYAL